jgi:predicted nucleic acid-binding protein
VTRFLIDSSALWRLLRSRRLHELWRPVVLDGDVRSCYLQRAEFLRSARDITEYEQYTEMFAELYPDVAVPKSAGQLITTLQHQAAQQGVHRALSAVDLQICATAAHHGLTVLHDDDDFVTAANLAIELHERNIHAGPAESI